MNFIANRQDLKAYISLRLGASVNIQKVEISDPQFELIIDEALKYLRGHNWGRGHYTQIGALFVKPGQSKYRLEVVEDENGISKLFDVKDSPSTTPQTSNIRQVLRVRDTAMFPKGEQLTGYNLANFVLTLVKGVNSASSKQSNVSLTGSVIDTVGSAGNVTGGVSATSSVADFIIPIREIQKFQQALEEFKATIGVRYSHTWRQHINELTIYPTPSKAGFLTVQYVMNEDDVNLFQEEMFLRLVVAISARQLLINLTKYTNEKLNLEQLKLEAEKYDAIIEEVEGRSQQPRMFWR